MDWDVLNPGLEKKKKSLFECVPMCLCVYARVCSYVCVCVCKYVLMGPLIKTPGVSAICQHWSIGQETDSSPCACECVRVLVLVCVCVRARMRTRTSVCSRCQAALCSVIVSLVIQRCHSGRNRIKTCSLPCAAAIWAWKVFCVDLWDAG